MRDDLSTTLAEAASLRDRHELDVHTYTHHRQTLISYPFTARMTSHGRSTLGRRGGDDVA